MLIIQRGRRGSLMTNSPSSLHINKGIPAVSLSPVSGVDWHWRQVNKRNNGSDKGRTRINIDQAMWTVDRPARGLSTRSSICVAFCLIDIGRLVMLFGAVPPEGPTARRTRIRFPAVAGIAYSEIT